MDAVYECIIIFANMSNPIFSKARRTKRVSFLKVLTWDFIPYLSIFKIFF
jgi:hypothetical protein